MAKVLNQLWNVIKGKQWSSQQDTLPLLHWLRRLEGCENRLVKHVFQPFLCESGALHVLDSSQLSGEFFGRVNRHWFLLHFEEFFGCGCIVTEINLCPNEKEWCLWTMMCDLWYPLSV